MFKKEYSNLFIKGSSKGQSAMEYLMTYGWSILLIAVAIIVLFKFGAFNSSNVLPTACIAQVGYSCSNVTLDTSGYLEVMFKQASGYTYTITGLGCSNSTLEPEIVQINPLVAPNGASETLTLKCTMPQNTIGTHFSGTLWIQYTENGASGQVSEVGTVTAKVTTQQVFAGTYSSYVSLSVPITLTNTQNSATFASFQQMLSIDSAQYSQYINSGWQNVEFTTGNYAADTPGTTLQAWVESGNSNTVSNTIVWVNLPSGIAALSSITIYMDFMTNNVMSSSGPTGEAPQLSSTYAQYDNGAKVFSFYDSFSGSSLDSKWVCETGCSGGAYSVENGLIITENTIIASSATYLPSVLETYGMHTAAYMDTNPYSEGYITTLSPLNGYVRYDYLVNGYDYCDWGVYISGTLTQFSCTNENTNGVYTLEWPATGTEIGKFNYIQQFTSSNDVIPISNAYIYLQANIINNNMNVQWIRTRTYPPNGVMPTQNTGSAVNVPTGIVYYLPVMLTNSQSNAVTTNTQIMIPFDAQSYSSYEASSLSNTEFFYANGTVVPSWMEGNVLNEQQISNLNTAANVIYWVKLAPQISANGGTQKIYIGFAPTSTNLLNNVNTGEAPQLSSSYAEYDNGASVFNIYYNFAGTVTSTSFGSTGSTIWVQNNGISINTNVNSNVGIYYKTENVLPTYFSFLAWTTNSISVSSHLLQMVTPTVGAYPYYYGLSGASGQGISSTGTITTAGSAFRWTVNTPYVFSSMLTPSTQTGYINYVNMQTDTSSLGTDYLEEWQDATNDFVQWFRTSTYPPNGIMPTVMFGSIS